MVLAKTAIDALKDKHLDAAAQWAIETLISRVEGEAGCILIDRHGRIGWAHNSPDMAVAYMSENLAQPVFFTRKDQSFAQSL